MRKRYCKVAGENAGNATNYFKVIDDVGDVLFPFGSGGAERAWGEALEYKAAVEANGRRRDANGEVIRASRIVVWRRLHDSRWLHLGVVGEGEGWGTTRPELVS